MRKEFFIEISNPDGTYTVASRHDTYQDGMEALKAIDSPLHHELWSYGWVHTDAGFAPIASIN